MACNLGTSPTKVCAYCLYHKSTMSQRQMKRRKCEKKQCHALKPRMEHPYWKKKEESRRLRKEKKEREKAT